MGPSIEQNNMDCRPAVDSWFQTELGQILLAQEQLAVSERLARLYGLSLLQLSGLSEQDLSGASNARYNHHLGAWPQASSGALAQFDALPLPEQSVDMVLLHHVLEFSQNPHQVLREVDRVLVPEGHVLIVGINPWSLFGLRTRALAAYGDSPWRGQLLSLSRMTDWLSLLDLRITGINYLFHQPPLQAPGLLHRTETVWRHARRYSLPGGGVYLIEARKQVVGMTPVRPRRRYWRPEVGSLGVVNPSVPASKTLH